MQAARAMQDDGHSPTSAGNDREFRPYLTRLTLAAAMWIGAVAPSFAVTPPLKLWAPYVAYDVGGQPNAIVAADLNGDGLSDLAITHGLANPPAITIFLGRSDGGFDRGADLTPSLGPIGLI